MDTVNESIKKTHHLVCVEGKLYCLVAELHKFPINSNDLVNCFDRWFDLIGSMFSIFIKKSWSRKKRALR